MKDIKPSTTNEDKLFKSIQTAIGAYANGIIGMQTMTDLAAKVGANGFPVTTKLYGYPTIICNDIIPFACSTSLKSYANTISGSFSFNKKPCSILVQNGQVIAESSCHAFLNKPESVIYRTNKGIGIKRCTYASDLPEGTRWAVGGMGLIDFYNPTAEGFDGAYADVLRKTNHTVLGEKNGKLYLIYFANMTAEQINSALKNRNICSTAILLDGGHVAAINGSETFAKINVNQVQYYAIQGV